MADDLDVTSQAEPTSDDAHGEPSAAQPSRPRLHAVIEAPADAPPFVAPLPPRPWPRHVRLWAETPDAEVSLVVAQLAQYGHGGGGPRDLAALAKAFPTIASGGISASDALQEVFPSCCCGVETWREWREILTAGTAPWLGHDPSPWVEVSEDVILVWPDGGLGEATGDDMRPVRFSRAELESALTDVEADLRGFQHRLRAWAAGASPELAGRVADRFGALVGVSATPLPPEE